MVKLEIQKDSDTDGSSEETVDAREALKKIEETILLFNVLLNELDLGNDQREKNIKFSLLPRIAVIASEARQNMDEIIDLVFKYYREQ